MFLSFGIINNLINEIKRLGFSFSLILRKRGWEWATGAEQHSPAGCKRYPWSRNVATGTGWGSRWWHPWHFKTCRSWGPLLLLLQERTPLPLLLRQRCLLSSDTEVRESESWTQMMTLSGLALPRPDLLKGQWFFTTVFLSSLDPMKLWQPPEKKALQQSYSRQG